MLCLACGSVSEPPVRDYSRTILLPLLKAVAQCTHLEAYNVGTGITGDMVAERDPAPNTPDWAYLGFYTALRHVVMQMTLLHREIRLMKITADGMRPSVWLTQLSKQGACLPQLVARGGGHQGMRFVGRVESAKGVRSRRCGTLAIRLAVWRVRMMRQMPVCERVSAAPAGRPPQLHTSAPQRVKLALCRVTLRKRTWPLHNFVGR